MMINTMVLNRSTRPAIFIYSTCNFPQFTFFVSMVLPRSPPRPSPSKSLKMSASHPPKKRMRRTISLLTLPDEILAHIITILPPKPAFLLSLTNSRLYKIYTVSATTIDATTPFRAQSLYTRVHINSLLRHTKNLKTLKLTTSLPDVALSLPLNSLQFDQSFSDVLSLGVLNIPTLRHLHIHYPRPSAHHTVRSVISQLTSLTLTNIPDDGPILEHSIESVMQSNLHHLTLSLQTPTIRSFEKLGNALQPLKEHTTLRSLSCGIDTPENVSRSFTQASQHRLFITISCLLQHLRERPPPRGSPLRKVHIFSPSFTNHLLFLDLKIATDADLTFSFEANTLQFPLSGGCVVTELASMPTMRYLTEVDRVIPKLHTFNFVLRELATSYTPECIQGLAGLITTDLHTFRAQIPLRSCTSLNQIASTLSDIMKLSTRVRNLHVSREVVHFAEEGLMPSFLRRWGSVKALYLTAPEKFPQFPYPEQLCRKYSAWRFIVSLPRFLEILPHVSPRLEVLMLEEIGSMNNVENPTAMTRVIETALDSVRKFEQVLPGVDASTVRAQLLVWRSRFLQEVMACEKFICSRSKEDSVG